LDISQKKLAWFIATYEIPGKNISKKPFNKRQLTLYYLLFTEGKL